VAQDHQRHQPSNHQRRPLEEPTQLSWTKQMRFEAQQMVCFESFPPHPSAAVHQSESDFGAHRQDHEQLSQRLLVEVL
jgi:hypothetical protein